MHGFTRFIDKNTPFFDKQSSLSSLIMGVLTGFIPMADQPYILFVGNDPSLEYLLERYAQRSGCGVRCVRDMTPDLDMHDAGLKSVWFSSLDMLESFQPLRPSFLNLDIPIVVCSSIADDARAVELGADYMFLHPITFDSFQSALEGGNKPDKVNP
jgi:CheY-like chemotaxis protein